MPDLLVCFVDAALAGAAVTVIVQWWLVVRNKNQLFGFRCPECGKGMVQDVKLKDYRTRIKGCQFEVPLAVIGVCTACGCQIFDPAETKRWEREYEVVRSQCGSITDLMLVCVLLIYTLIFGCFLWATWRIWYGQ